jgi:hypothetical protein
VWKVHYATPNWVEGTEGCGYLCDCTGTDISWHDPPLLYNIGKDPSERNLLQAHQYPEVTANFPQADSYSLANFTNALMDYLSIVRLFFSPYFAFCFIASIKSIMVRPVVS